MKQKNAETEHGIKILEKEKKKHKTLRDHKA
jgi:hypothetical protein